MKQRGAAARVLVGLILAVATLLDGVDPASAGTLVVEPPSSHHAYQRWVDKALVPTPNVTVTVLEFGTPEEAARLCGAEAYGCESCVTGADGSPTCTLGLVVGAGEDRRVFFHEQGHIWDEQGFLRPLQRVRFLEQVRQSDRAWLAEGPHPPNEWFAEAYAACATLPVIPDRGRYLLFGQDRWIGGGSLRPTCQMLGRRDFG